MLTGTDEHGLKIERAAAEATTPLAFVDEMSARASARRGRELVVEPDDFIRTTEPRHIEPRAGALATHRGARATSTSATTRTGTASAARRYKTEKELLPGNVCPLHQQARREAEGGDVLLPALEVREAAPRLLRRSTPSFIEPETRRNEVMSFVQGGLKDLCVSRTSFTWGIPVPGNPKHVMYVWFDALANYWTALGPEGDPLRRFWPKPATARAPCTSSARTSCASTRSTGRRSCSPRASARQLPSQVFAHGFLTIDGQKMSKSLRNAVDPVRLAQRARRRTCCATSSSARSRSGRTATSTTPRMLERYNADLGKNLGNLLPRTLGLCAKLTPGQGAARARATRARGRLLVGEALAHDAGGRAPSWERARRRTARSSDAGRSARSPTSTSTTPRRGRRRRTGTSTRVGDDPRDAARGARAAVSVMIWPVMPKKSDEMRAQLGLPPDPARRSAPTSGRTSGRGRPGRVRCAPASRSFPRYDADAAEALLDEARAQDRSARPTSAAATASARRRKPRRAPKPVILRRSSRRSTSASASSDAASACPRRTSSSGSTVDLGEADAAPDRRRARARRSRPKRSSAGASSSWRTSRRATSARGSSRTGCCSRRARASPRCSRRSTGDAKPGMRLSSDVVDGRDATRATSRLEARAVEGLLEQRAAPSPRRARAARRPPRRSCRPS